MINLRMMRSISKLQLARISPISSIHAQKYVSWLDNRLGCSVYHGLSTKILQPSSSRKQMNQADVQHLKAGKKEAESYLSVKQYDLSLKIFQAIADFLLKNGYINFEYAQTLTSIGQIYKLKNKHTQALESLKKAIDVLNGLQGNYGKQKAIAKKQIAELFYLQQNYQQAERELQESKKQFMQNLQDLQLIDIFFHLGRVKMEKKQYKTAIADFHKYYLLCFKDFIKFKSEKERLAWANENMAKIVACILNIISCHSFLKDHTAALADAEQALRLFYHLGLQSSNEYSMILQIKGRIHRDFNQKLQFLDCFEKALAIRQQKLGKDHPDLLSLLQCIGNIILPSRQLPCSITSIVAIFFDYSLDRIKEEVAVFACARIYQKNEEWHKALKFYDYSVDISIDTNNMGRMAFILQQKAQIHYTLEEFTQSLDLALTSILVLRKIHGDFKVQDAEIFPLIAKIYQKLGDEVNNIEYEQIGQRLKLLKSKTNKK